LAVSAEIPAIDSLVLKMLFFSSSEPTAKEIEE
jgi:hypothetical protein